MSPVPCARKAAASAMESSMASFVPDPMEKCAVWAASPTSTVFPWCHRPQETVGKDRQRDRLVRSRCPRSSSAKRASQ